MPTAVVRRLKVSDGAPRDVLVTGGTGFMGVALVEALVARGHRVRVLTRQKSAAKVPAGAQAVIGDALDAASVKAALRPGDTVVHLVGAAVGPAAGDYERVDLGSIRTMASAARGAGILHLVYVSVAQPAPIMRAYVAVRAAGEKAISDAGLRATVLRPWYVLGPGRRWPMLLLPLYWLASVIPPLREGARRTAFVTIDQMVIALVRAVERPAPKGISIVDVPMIRQATLDGPPAA